MKGIVTRVKLESDNFLYSIFIEMQPENLTIMLGTSQSGREMLPVTDTRPLVCHDQKKILGEVEVSDELVSTAIKCAEAFKKFQESKKDDPDRDIFGEAMVVTLRELSKHADEFLGLLAPFRAT